MRHCISLASMLCLEKSKDASMSAEHGEIGDIPGWEETDSTPEIEPLMEPLQPRRPAVPRREGQATPRTPSPMLLPANAAPIPVPDPQTPAPLPAFSVPDPQTPAPFPGLLSAPAVSD